jgi:gluconate 5-dehydrogenase
MAGLTPNHPPLPADGVGMFKVDGKVALITGSSKGLGKGMAAGLAQAGAHVIINSRNQDECAAAADEITAAGGKATAIAFDVTGRFCLTASPNPGPYCELCLPRTPDEATVVAMVAKIATDFGRLDILVNNAGGTRRSPFLESTTEDLDWVVNLNLRGPYIMARECGKQMKAQVRLIRMGLPIAHGHSSTVIVSLCFTYRNMITWMINPTFLRLGWRQNY